MALDIPLQYHEFRHLNHDERCPRFSEILKRPFAEGIQASELDSLFTDLETLQGASNIRLRRLENELKILTEWCDKRDKRLEIEKELEFIAPPPTTVASSSATARLRPGIPDEKPMKKQKTEEKSGCSKVKSKGKAMEVEKGPDVYVSKPKLTYDTPNKFWSFVEPYCTEITADDIKSLEDSLSSKADMSEYFKVLPLGRHYSIVWAKEDLEEEQLEGAKADKKRTSVVADSNADPLDVDSALKNVEGLRSASEPDESCPYGTFTQRLISALVDENIMAPMGEADFGDGIKVEDDVLVEQRTPQGKKLPLVSNAKSLENAIKEELFALRLIDSTDDEEADFDAEDEVLAELRRCQSELKALRSHNKHAINRLLARARRELKKQSLKQRAKVLDAEVMDLFRRISSSKLKKKGLTRKDREAAWKAIREREAVWKMIENAESNEKAVH